MDIIKKLEDNFKELKQFDVDESYIDGEIENLQFIANHIKDMVKKELSAFSYNRLFNSIKYLLIKNKDWIFEEKDIIMKMLINGKIDILEICFKMDKLYINDYLPDLINHYFLHNDKETLKYIILNKKYIYGGYQHDGNIFINEECYKTLFKKGFNVHDYINGNKSEEWAFICSCYDEIKHKL
jgi:hypothetical protein